MSNLAVAEGQNQQQLADALGIHRNNMVGLVDEMEAAGWLRRERSSTDRRAFQLHLTRQGRSIVTQVDRLVPVIEHQITGGLSHEQRCALVATLRQLADGLGLEPGIHPHLATNRRPA